MQSNKTCTPAAAGVAAAGRINCTCYGRRGDLEDGCYELQGEALENLLGGGGGAVGGGRGRVERGCRDVHGGGCRRGEALVASGDAGRAGRREAAARAAGSAVGARLQHGPASVVECGWAAAAGDISHAYVTCRVKPPSMIANRIHIALDHTRTPLLLVERIKRNYDPTPCICVFGSERIVYIVIRPWSLASDKWPKVATVLSNGVDPERLCFCTAIGSRVWCTAVWVEQRSSQILDALPKLFELGWVGLADIQVLCLVISGNRQIHTLHYIHVVRTK
eukprot:COSAG01_NODE_13419_length_1588_cov_1.441236_1_plen_278_part_00